MQHGQLPPQPHSPGLHERKQNKKQNHPKWLKLWVSISFHHSDFLAIFQRTEKKKRKKKSKQNVNCYGNKLMFQDYSFHYRKWSIWKLYTENGHTKFPTQTLLILARSSFPSPVAKPGPKCLTFRSEPLPSGHEQSRHGSSLLSPQHCSSKLGHMLCSGSECRQKLDRKIRTTKKQQPPKPNPLLHTVFMYLSIIRELGCNAAKKQEGFLQGQHNSALIFRENKQKKHLLRSC